MRFRFLSHPGLRDWVGVEFTADDGRHLLLTDLTRVQAERMRDALDEALGSEPK